MVRLESMNDPALSPVTQFLSAARAGDRNATSALFDLVYGRLRDIASAQLRRAPDMPTLNTTVVVHEAYLRLGGRTLTVTDRNHFYAVAAVAMRNILMDHARARRAQKRGGASPRVSIDDVDVPDAPASVDLLELNSALDRLGRLNERLARVVDLRFFAGLTAEEVAGVLGVTERTVRRDWELARAFLFHELNEGTAT